MKNIPGLECLVDCSPTNDDDKHTEGSHGFEVPRDSKKPQNAGRRGEMTEQTGNYPVDLTPGCHTMFVYCVLVQNEIRPEIQKQH